MTVFERQERIRARLAKIPPMTPDELRRQHVSFTYGNVAIDEPTVTRELVESIAARRR